ncbi:MAG: metallophosphoesterase [bacterium]
MVSFHNSLRCKQILLGLVIFMLQCFSTVLYAQSLGTVRFGVIGDYGDAGQAELDVSNLIKSWNVDLLITTGDNNYPNGEASTIDENIGQYYHEFIFPYVGNYGQGDSTNRFFPCLGNHDWRSPGATPYLNYFTLPGNERYYDFSWGPVHFFVIDSDNDEPDGISSTSIQASWLQDQLVASSAPWKIVYLHHPPYSSGSHGSSSALQWPYEDWGATAVFAGHDHTYERIFRDDNHDDVVLPYFVNGLGGSSRYSFGAPVSGSQVRYADDYGAMLIEANEAAITFQFVTRTGVLIDTYTITDSTVDVDTPVLTDLPRHFALKQNFPNPFNPSTTIEFSLPRSAYVILNVYNVLGEEVATLLSETLPAARYTYNWNASGLASGVYYYRLQAGEFSETKRLLLLR